MAQVTKPPLDQINYKGHMNLKEALCLKPTARDLTASCLGMGNYTDIQEEVLKPLQLSLSSESKSTETMRDGQK